MALLPLISSISPRFWRVLPYANCGCRVLYESSIHSIFFSRLHQQSLGGDYPPQEYNYSAGFPSAAALLAPIPLEIPLSPNGGQSTPPPPPPRRPPVVRRKEYIVAKVLEESSTWADVSCTEPPGRSSSSVSFFRKLTVDSAPVGYNPDMRSH